MNFPMLHSFSTTKIHAWHVLVLSAFGFALVSKVPAQQIVPSVQWEQIYKDSVCDFNSVAPTDNGGFLLGGRIYDIADELGEDDCVLLKVGSQGELQWEKTYGGFGNESIKDLRQCFDGGFVFAAISNSLPSGAKYTWVVKVDREGTTQWEQTFEGSAASILTVREGGYLIVGGGAWLAKVDEKGSKEWERDLHREAGVQSARQMSDGGFILAGYTRPDPPHFGNADGWLLKVDAKGNEQWERFFGGTEFDYFHSVDETENGGFILAGRSGSPPSGNKESPRLTEMDYWIVKVDVEGNKEWDRSFGMALSDPNIRRAPDHGYVFTTESGLTRIDSRGIQEWEQPLDHSGEKVYIQDFELTEDGGYALCGSFWPPDVGIPVSGCVDFGWAAKLERVVTRSPDVVAWQTVPGALLESTDSLDGQWSTNEIKVLPIGDASAISLHPTGPQRYYRLREPATSSPAPVLSLGALLTWPVALNQKLEFSPDNEAAWQIYQGNQGVLSNTHHAIIPLTLCNHYFRTRTENFEVE